MARKNRGKKCQLPGSLNCHNLMPCRELSQEEEEEEEEEEV
jgi:hypothetical protein